MAVNSYFEGTYPNITTWLTFGFIEMGESEHGDAFIKAYDDGGVVWEGEESYRTIDAAFRDLENALEEINQDRGL